MTENPASVENLIGELDSTLHEPVRLGILMLLHLNSSLTFSVIQKGLNVTSGNLNTHLTKLDTEGLITKEKTFVNLRPTTVVQITVEGRKALRKYSKSLKRILLGIQEGAEEDPIMLTIMVSGGMTLFNRVFNQEITIKEELMGGFLATIEEFSNEVFSKSLKLVTLGKHRLIMRIQDYLIFSYIYKGESYPATKRLTLFIQNLQKEKTLWENLTNKVRTGAMLRNTEKEAIEQYLVENFLFGGLAVS